MRLGLLLLVFLHSASLARFAEAQAITVSAAVSLKDALADVAGAYERQTGQTVRLNFGASGHLLAQIREGAPVDVFIAAADEQLDQAERLGLLEPSTRATIAGNELVLIVPADSKLAIRSFADLATADLKRLAIGQPRTVPAGAYAVQVIDALDLRARLEDRLVHAASVRQVLDYVERGEVDAGVTYLTDAERAGDRVRMIARARAEWHEPIRYSAAVVRSSRQREGADRFVKFLVGEAAKRTFERHGFALLAPPAPPAPPAAPAIPATQPSASEPSP